MNWVYIIVNCNCDKDDDDEIMYKSNPNQCNGIVIWIFFSFQNLLQLQKGQYVCQSFEKKNNERPSANKTVTMDSMLRKIFS